MTAWTDDNNNLLNFAEQGKENVERNGSAIMLAGAVEALAKHVLELTVEVRRLKHHDARAVDTWETGEPNDYGNFRGTCSCGWSTAWGTQESALGWVENHLALYAEAS